MTRSPDEVRAGAARYLEVANTRDPDAIAALFAEDGTFEDPVGTPVHVGREAVRGMFKGAAESLQAMKLTLTSPMSVAGNCAAYALVADTEMGGTAMSVDVIELIAFDDDGLITSVQAYWNFADVRSTPLS